MEIDPVCGMEVDPATAKYQTQHNSKEYFFCAKGCLESFQKDPDRFLENKNSEAIHPIQAPAATSIPKLQKLPDQGSDLSFAIQGMSCASCVARIEDSLQKVDGIYGASVNLATNTGSVKYDPAK